MSKDYDDNNSGISIEVSDEALFLGLVAAGVAGYCIYNSDSKVVDTAGDAVNKVFDFVGNLIF